MTDRKPPTSQETATGVLETWRIACGDVDRASPKNGLTLNLVAPDEDRAEIAALLDLTACTTLTATVTLRARAGGRYAASGRVQASVEQPCVATLEPVFEQIDERFEAEFCPASEQAATGPHDPSFDPDADDEPLTIEDGTLHLGQLVFEYLAVSIDLFPRADGVEDVALEVGPRGKPRATSTKSGSSESALAEPDQGRPNPFAVLAKLRPGNDH